jgi:stearoyl-CoA desaturase (delta-9 desaturase)
MGDDAAATGACAMDADTTRFRWRQLSWPNSLFLLATLAVAVTGVPLYLACYGLDGFQAGLFFAFFAATGLSITAGYHRLFTHASFQASLPVRLFALVFGAASFQNSVLCWAADHRRHHKSVDRDEDPYNIKKGFFHAHVGWVMAKTPAPTAFGGVRDLERDPWIRWQHRYYLPIAVLAGFVLPTVLGQVWGGWRGALGAFLIGGVARVVFVHHLTFFINSLSHMWGRQPYSARCTARDNAALAWLTFGEGYHNFHHAFQYDYRNGVKPWQFDPTKWLIWTLQWFGLARRLRRVPSETIRLAEAAEQHRQLSARLDRAPAAITAAAAGLLQSAHDRLHRAAEAWERGKADYRRAAEANLRTSCDRLAELRREFTESRRRLHQAIRDWQQTYRQIEAYLAGRTRALA